jgi:hypothetical protein
VAQRLLIVRSVRFNTTVATVIVFVLTTALCPWMWKSLPDGYFPYSGTVVDKGEEFHLFIAGENHWDNYIVVEDSHGRREKKYVGDYAHAIVQVGTFVVKKRGFSEIPLRPGQTDPRDILRKIQERNKR